MLEKSITELTYADIQDLVSRNERENERVEFKSGLDRSGAKLENGRWKIGHEAKKDLLKAVVALANARGGYLILGVAESTEYPGQAGSVTPIKHCVQLRDRIHDIIRNSIDPRLGSYSARDLLDPNDPGTQDGVIAIFVPKSNSAPHRSQVDKEIYVRRGDSSVPLTMFEAQDFTINSFRGFERVDERFRVLRDEFAGDLDRWAASEYCAIRVSAVPSYPSPLVDDVLSQDLADLGAIKEFLADSGQQVALSLGCDSFPRRILRGAEQLFESESCLEAVRFYCDGTVNSFLSIRTDDAQRIFYCNNILAHFTNAAYIADRLRCHVGVADAEVGIEFELRLTGPAVNVTWEKHRMGFGKDWGRRFSGSQIFPRYAFRTTSEFAALSNRFWKDISHFFRSDNPRPWLPNIELKPR